MLAIQKANSSAPQCTPNVLPCRIHHNGPVNAADRFWAPCTAEDGKPSSYFRGRKLVGKSLKLSEGYQGTVATTVEKDLPQSLPRNTTITGTKDFDEMDDEEGEEDVPVTKVLAQQASFDEMIIWGHEAEPDGTTDAYIKGINEWIQFAETMHSVESTLEAEKSSSESTGHHG